MKLFKLFPGQTSNQAKGNRFCLRWRNYVLSLIRNFFLRDINVVYMHLYELQFIYVKFCHEKVKILFLLRFLCVIDNEEKLQFFHVQNRYTTLSEKVISLNRECQVLALRVIIRRTFLPVILA